MSEYNTRSTPTVHNKPFRKKPANSPEGHAAFLKAIENAQGVIRVMKTSGEIRKGSVKTSDKYTISLKETREDGSYQVYVIFKHAIEEFWTDPADNPKQG